MRAEYEHGKVLVQKDSQELVLTAEEVIDLHRLLVEQYKPCLSCYYGRSIGSGLICENKEQRTFRTKEWGYGYDPLLLDVLYVSPYNSCDKFYSITDGLI